MVLAELGQRISQALGSLNSVPVVDEAVRRPARCRASCAAQCCRPALAHLVLSKQCGVVVVALWPSRDAGMLAPRQPWCAPPAADAVQAGLRSATEHSPTARGAV